MIRLQKYLIPKKYKYVGAGNSQFDKCPYDDIDKIAFYHDISYNIKGQIPISDCYYSKKFILTGWKNNNIFAMVIGIILYIKYVIEIFGIKIYP